MRARSQQDWRHLFACFANFDNHIRVAKNGSDIKPDTCGSN